MDSLKQLRKNVEEFRRNITRDTKEQRIDHIGFGMEQTYKNFEDFVDQYNDMGLSRDELKKIYDENVVADFSELITKYLNKKELDWLYESRDEEQEIYNSWEEFYEKYKDSGLNESELKIIYNAEDCDEYSVIVSGCLYEKKENGGKELLGLKNDGEVETMPPETIYKYIFEYPKYDDKDLSEEQKFEIFYKEYGDTRLDKDEMMLVYKYTDRTNYKGIGERFYGLNKMKNLIFRYKEQNGGKKLIGMRVKGVSNSYPPSYKFDYYFG